MNKSSGGRKSSRECPRCGVGLPADVKFCPECGAPAPYTQAFRLEKREPSSGGKGKPHRTGKLERRLLLGFLGILAMALSAIVLLMVEDYQEVGAAVSQSATETIFLTPSPSPSPTPSLSPEELFYGAWSAARIETNKNKVKPYIEVKIDTPLIIVVGEDGLMTGLTIYDDETVEVFETVYSFEGDSIYVYQGELDIEGASYQGRARYFFSKGELRCVYLLNGREASDYMVFSLFMEYQPPDSSFEPERGEPV